MKIMNGSGSLLDSYCSGTVLTTVSDVMLWFYKQPFIAHVLFSGHCNTYCLAQK